ncbi:MAG TPA: TIGR02996 domain-containing protein [Kofleriaceae bacterium]|jgi:uncharacterized protein (TIGR02996 family)|nr:TIGR02996 domain-containing protein [Kofleriaceae bacterium]
MDSLDRALALWRAKPTCGHAALVDRASRVVRREDEPLDVLRAMRTSLDEIAVLARRPSDPRIGVVMVQMLEALASGEDRSRFDWGSTPALWRPLFEMFAAADATIAPRLRVIADRERAARDRMATRLAPKLDEIADALEARDDVDLPAARALAADLDRLEARRRDIDDTSVELFDAVWAAPDDDGPRLVLADFLNEHADPRGEFIALQLGRAAGKLGAAGRKREKKLLGRNKRAWIGAIAPLVRTSDARFERGFIVGCQLAPDDALALALGDHPAWSTIREFTVHPLIRDVQTTVASRLRIAGAKRVDALTLGIA